MRRPYAFLSVALVLLGLELSTKAVSLALVRLRTGLGAVFTGVEFHVSGTQFLLGLAMLLVGVGLAMVSVVLARAERRVTGAGDSCPSCGSGTKRVKRHRLHRYLSVLMGQRLTRRQCERCGWVGLSLRF